MKEDSAKAFDEIDPPLILEIFKITTKNIENLKDLVRKLELIIFEADENDIFISRSGIELLNDMYADFISSFLVNKFNKSDFSILTDSISLMIDLLTNRCNPDIFEYSQPFVDKLKGYSQVLNRMAFKIR